MRKVMYFLLLGFFCLLSQNGLAQGTGPSDGEGNTEPDEDLPIMTESEGGKGYRDCVVRFSYEIYAANLEMNAAGDYVFPPNTPFMHLKVKMVNESGEDVFESIYPVGDWRLIPGSLGNLGKDEVGLDETAFISTIGISADLEDHCIDPDIPRQLFLQVELIMISHRGEEPYPICYYSDPGSIYSCNVFQGITCPDTSGTFVSGDSLLLTGCDEEALTYHEEIFRPQCDCFDDSEFNGGGTSRAANGNSNGSLTGSQPFEVSVLANPFQDQLQLNWLGNTKVNTEALIYNSTGQLIESISINEETGHRVLNTADWTSGLYFLVSGTGENQQVLKLIKP